MAAAAWRRCIASGVLHIPGESALVLVPGPLTPERRRNCTPTKPPARRDDE